MHSRGISANSLGPGLIGPNAIIRVAQVMREDFGATETEDLFRAADLEPYLRDPPRQMVNQDEVTALHRQLRDRLGIARARLVSRRAGLLTADYLLANRIPQPAQAILRILPAPLASRALLAAIRRNAWTFTGNGEFSARPGNPLQISIAGCAICRGASSDEPICDYYSATFERLFRALVDSRAVVVETSCEAAGAQACSFEVAW